MVRNYPPAWVCRMLLPMGDEKLCQRDLVTTIPLCPSLQLDSFYQMLCSLTRGMAARRCLVVSGDINTANPSGSHLFYILYLVGCGKNLKDFQAGNY